MLGVNTEACNPSHGETSKTCAVLCPTSANQGVRHCRVVKHVTLLHSLKWNVSLEATREKQACQKDGLSCVLSPAFTGFLALMMTRTKSQRRKGQRSQALRKHVHPMLQPLPYPPLVPSLQLSLVGSYTHSSICVACCWASTVFNQGPFTTSFPLSMTVPALSKEHCNAGEDILDGKCYFYAERL